MSRPSTVGGSLAVAASAVLLVLAMVRGSGSAVASAEAAPWLPPAYEFQIQGVEPAEPVALSRAAVPLPVADEATVRQTASTGSASRSPASSALASSVPLAPSLSSPELLSIGHRAAGTAAAPATAPALDLGRLSELSGLVQSLYRALTEAREAGSTGPLLALSPGLGTGMAAPAGSAPGVSGAPLLASAGSPTGSGPDFVDPNGQTIAAIERRLDQQIRQNRSPPEIAETRFALAQAIWSSSDAEAVQTRALTLARQSKAALDAVSGQDTSVSVTELRQAVSDWISERERPLGKPQQLVVGRGPTDLKLDPGERGPTNLGF